MKKKKRTFESDPSDERVRPEPVVKVALHDTLPTGRRCPLVVERGRGDDARAAYVRLVLVHAAGKRKITPIALARDL